MPILQAIFSVCGSSFCLMTTLACVAGVCLGLRDGFINLKQRLNEDDEEE